MSRPKEPRPLEPIDRRQLEERLERITRDHFRNRTLDRLEKRYLSSLASNSLFLLADLYDTPTIARILHLGEDEPEDWSRLLEPVSAEDAATLSLRRFRSVPDEVRLIGEKCLYDVGLFGKRLHQGYDLPELGVASYRLASALLQELSSDERLRKFFEADRIGRLRIEEEVTFLRQCARHFADYAAMLSHLHLFGDDPPVNSSDSEEENEEEETARDEGLLPAIRSTRQPLQTGSAELLEPEPIDEAEAEAEVAAEVDDAGLTPQERLSYLERLLLFSSLDIDRLRRQLRRVVIDQPRAIDAICDDFSLFGTGTHSRRRPLSYFFIGPTGVGKNHLVEQLTGALGALWCREVPLLLIEGPGYTYPSDINELKGSTRGFIRSDEEGILTEFHHRATAAPFSVILVDEVEKAHPQLRKFFLSLMDRGTTTDNRGQLLNFSSTMLVYTSNLGYSRLQQASDPIGFADQDARADFRRRDLGNDLKRELSPEFVNRLRVIHFDPLSEKSIRRIFDLELAKIARRYLRFQGLELVVTVAARRALLARGYSPEHGARHLSRVLNEVCNVGVAKRLRRDGARNDEEDGAGLLEYIQEARREERQPDLEMLERKVLARARALVPYRRLRIDYGRGRFSYRPS